MAKRSFVAIAMGIAAALAILSPLFIINEDNQFLFIPVYWLWQLLGLGPVEKLTMVLAGGSGSLARVYTIVFYAVIGGLVGWGWVHWHEKRRTQSNLLH